MGILWGALVGAVVEGADLLGSLGLAVGLGLGFSVWIGGSEDILAVAVGWGACVWELFGCLGDEGFFVAGFVAAGTGVACFGIVGFGTVGFETAGFGTAGFGTAGLSAASFAEAGFSAAELGIAVLVWWVEFDEGEVRETLGRVVGSDLDGPAPEINK